MDFLRSLVNRATIVKLLLILAYSQMLIQQMDNQAHLIQDLQSGSSVQQQLVPGGACCHGGQAAAADQPDDPSLTDWFNCMWTSAKACSSPSVSMANNNDKSTLRPLFFRLMSSLIDFCTQTFDSIMLLAMIILQKLASIHLLLHSVGAVWIARWRSPIVHRLVQSILVQVSYIGSLLMSSDGDDDDDYY